jgi:hypothetical protein
MRNLILSNFQSVGDILLITAAVRDLHRCHPGVFQTDVRTPFPQLWENNAFLTPLLDGDPDVDLCHCHYPLIDQSNKTPFHFIYGFSHFLNERLGLNISPTEFRVNWGYV